MSVRSRTWSSVSRLIMEYGSHMTYRTYFSVTNVTPFPPSFGSPSPKPVHAFVLAQHFPKQAAQHARAFAVRRPRRSRASASSARSRKRTTISRASSWVMPRTERCGSNSSSSAGDTGAASGFNPAEHVQVAEIQLHPDIAERHGCLLTFDIHNRALPGKGTGVNVVADAQGSRGSGVLGFRVPGPPGLRGFRSAFRTSDFLASIFFST